MGSTSSATPDVISLPHGGGALKGLGEKFSPDLFTGTGNFTIPIALPPGRNGFQPQLSLGYSTGNGNGPFGQGWSLSIPGVSRKTSKGIPRYRDKPNDPLLKPDVFILSGAEDLVAVEGAPAGAQRYRPRTEGLFALIDHFRSDGNDYWKVQSKDGLISYYGTPGLAGSDPAVIANPTARSKIFTWKLSRTEDPFGNRIEYEYTRDQGKQNNSGSAQWDQLYLKGENQRGRESFLELQEEIEQVDGNAGGQTSCVVERNKGIGNLLLTAAEGGGKGDRLLYLCQDNRHG